jgi:bifunctional DNase/RNase
MTRAAAALLAILSALQCTPKDKSPSPTASASASSEAGRRDTAKSPAREVPKGFVEASVGTVIATSQGNAVMLVDEATRKALLVFVGDTEALSIHLRLEGKKYSRPLTHDLLDNVLSKLGASVVSVRVDRLDNDIFYSVVSVSHDGVVEEFDSRTSDAIALAIGSRVPVFLSKEVLARVGVALDADGMPSGATSAKVGSGKAPVSL